MTWLQIFIFKGSRQNTRSVLFDEFVPENPQENWRNKNLDIAKPFKPRRCQTSILEPSRSSLALPVFKNANLWNKKKSNRPQLMHNTCTFDFIFQVYAACYLDYPNFKEFANKNAKLEFFSLLIDFCGCKEKDMDKLMHRRERLLYTTFSELVTTKLNITELNCWMSVIDMFIGLAKQTDILCSVSENRHCPVCSYHERVTKTSLPVSCHD